MNDKRASEEKLMSELELMYQHAADLESGDVPDERHHDPKIIPFPGKGIDSPSREPSEASEPLELSETSEISEPPKPAKASRTSKTSKTLEPPEPPESSEAETLSIKEPYSRTYVIVVSCSVIFLASVLLMVILDLITGPRSSKKREVLEVTAPIQLKSPPPVQKQENVSQATEEQQPQPETVAQETVESKSPSQQAAESKSPSHQTVELKSPAYKTIESKSSAQQAVESKSPSRQTVALKSRTYETIESKSLPPQPVELEPVFTESMHYAVQVGAFCNWRNASRRVDSLRKENLEPYWIARQSRSRGTVYVIFSGSFTNRREALEFMEGKELRKNYPGSFVRGISFETETHPLESSATPISLGSGK